MDRTTDGLEGVFAYIDDSRVGSPVRQTHLRHLEAFFTTLAANGLAINLEKCVFAILSLEILGHKILATGVAPTMFAWHGKLLLSFSAQVCTGFETFN